MANVGFNMNNEVQYRESINSPTGLLESFIANRKPSFTIDPECLPEAFFDWQTKFIGNTNMRLRMRVGTLNGNKFIIQAPGLAISGSQQGDRNGIKTRQITGTMASGSQSTSSLLRDNEFVIIYVSQ
jgi:hypothetical protein